MRRVLAVVIGVICGYTISFGIFRLTDIWGWPALLLFIPFLLGCFGAVMLADRREKYWRAKAMEAELRERERGL